MSCSCRGTLITPEWPSAHFWPFLRDGSSRFSSFVTEVFVLPAVGDLLLEGPGQKQIYRSRPSVFLGCPKFRMLALRLDFRLVALPLRHIFRARRCTFSGLFFDYAYLAYLKHFRA